DIPGWILARTAGIPRRAQTHLAAAENICLFGFSKAPIGAKPEIGIVDLAGFSVDVVTELGATHNIAIAHDKAVASYIHLTGIAPIIDALTFYDGIDTSYLGTAGKDDQTVLIGCHLGGDQERSHLILVQPSMQPAFGRNSQRSDVSRGRDRLGLSRRYEAEDEKNCLPDCTHE